MTHQSKRPYGGSQPSITSYFSPANSSTSTSPYNISAAPSSPLSPPVPASVQSNLLSVGMRIRKSVPEGYKTGTEYSAFQLFSDSTTPTERKMAAQTQTKQKTRPRAGARELMPFCGLLKVGGMGSQQWGIHDEDKDGNANGDMDEDDVPFLSSQGSTISSSSFASPPAGNKRRCDFDAEEDEDGKSKGDRLADVVPMQILGGLGDRVLAVPRRRKYQGNGNGKSAMGGQENRFTFGVGAEMDFGEAEFLDYSLVTDMDVDGV